MLDEFSIEVPNVIVEAYKYNVAANNFTLISTEKTDTNGQVIMKLYVPDTEYKFLVKQLGAIVYESDKFKLFTTSYTFRLSPTTTTTDIALSVSKIAHDWEYDKANGNLTLVWSDLTSTGNRYYMELYRSNATADQQLSVQSSTSSASSLNTTQNQSGYYVAFFYVNYSGDGNRYLVDTFVIDNKAAYDSLGVETLVMAFIYVGTVALVGITVGAEVALILTLISLLAFYWMGFINMGTGVGGIMSLVVVFIIFIVRFYRR